MCDPGVFILMEYVRKITRKHEQFLTPPHSLLLVRQSVIFFFIIARVFFTFLKKKKGLHQGTQQLAYPYIRIHNLFLVLYFHAPKEQRNIFFLVILYATVQSKKKKANRPSQNFSILNHFSVSVADAPFWEETEWLLIGKKSRKKQVRSHLGTWVRLKIEKL